MNQATDTPTDQAGGALVPASEAPGTSVISLPSPAAIAEFAQQMRGLEDTLTFDRIGVGKRSFEIPTGDGDEIEAASTIDGVIVYAHPSSVLYLTDKDDLPEGADNKPDAWSSDGVTQVVPQETIDRCKAEGKPIPNTVLAACPYNQWGSDPKGGKGKWTQNRYSVYIVRPGERFPKLLSLSPTSLKPYGNYVGKRLQFDMGVTPQAVLTRFSVSAQSNGGREWGEVRFAFVAPLSDGDRASVQALAEQLAPLFNRYAEAATIGGADSAIEGQAIDEGQFVPAAAATSELDAAFAAATPDPEAVF